MHTVITKHKRTHLREKSCTMCLVYKTTSPKRMKQHMLKSCKENKKEESCTKCLVYKKRECRDTCSTVVKGLGKGLFVKTALSILQIPNP